MTRVRNARTMWGFHRTGLTQVVLLASFVGLSACAPTVWARPDGSMAMAAIDADNCEHNVSEAGFLGVGLAGSNNPRALFRRCMQEAGYVPRR